MDIHISRTRAHRRDQLINFAGIESLGPRSGGSRDVRTYVGRQDCSRDRCRWRRARLNSCRTIAEIRAEEHANAAIHTLVSDVDMGLLDSAFEIRIAQFPFNSGFIVANPSIKGAVTGGRN